jgi:hypothetical protein
MKPLLITIIIFLFALSSAQSQLIEPTPDSSPQEFYDYYMIKSQRNNTAAWICLGGGAGLFTIGLAVGTAGILDWDSSEAGAGAGMMLAGTVGVAASIPLFIVSASNKRKARFSFERIQDKVGNIRIDNSDGFAVTLRIPLD